MQKKIESRIADFLWYAFMLFLSVGVGWKTVDVLKDGSHEMCEKRVHCFQVGDVGQWDVKTTRLHALPPHIVAILTIIHQNMTSGALCGLDVGVSTGWRLQTTWTHTHTHTMAPYLFQVFCHILPIPCGVHVLYSPYCPQRLIKCLCAILGHAYGKQQQYQVGQ